MQNIQQHSLFDVFENNTNTVTPIEKPRLTDEIKNDFAISGKTSIFRSGPSAPIKVLIEKGLLSKGSSLNFGKGKYNHDTDAIKAITSHCVGYDYVYLPDVDLLGASYENVFSGYVVNTLPSQSRKFVYCQMRDCTKGVCFIAARTDDIKGTPYSDGVKTNISTFQKSYKKGKLVSEASEYFEHVVEIKAKSGFSLIACSNKPLPSKILTHSKSQ